MLIILSLVILFIGVMIWYIFGKDEFIVPVVSFYPPEGISPPEAELIFNDNTTSSSSSKESNNNKNAKDYWHQSSLESLALQMVQKGWMTLDANYQFQPIPLTLEEIEKMTELERTCYDIFGALNNKTFDIENISLNSISGRMEIAAQVTETGSKWNKLMQEYSKKYFEPLNIFVGLIMFILPVTLFSIIGGNILFGFPIFGGITAGIAFISSLKVAPWEKVIILFFLGNVILGILYAITIELNRYSVVEIIVATLAGMILCALLLKMPKRTPLGDKIYGELLGFRNFLTKVDIPELDNLIKNDTDYFIKILPYAMELGVIHKNYRKEIFAYLQKTSAEQSAAFVTLMKKTQKK